MLDLYIRDIESSINDEGQEVLESGYYEWKIDNWNDNEFSSTFELCGYKWYFLLHIL